MTASKGLSPEVGRSGWCGFGFGRSICHMGDQANDSRRDGEDDRVRGWRETVGLYVLGCCPTVWRCDQRWWCDDVGWRRWWQVGQWTHIFPSSNWTASMRFSGFCVGISYGMPPGTWHLLKWGKHVFWWEGGAGVPSRYSPKTLLRRPKWSACGRLVGSIHRMTVDFRDMWRSRQSQWGFHRPQ